MRDMQQHVRMLFGYNQWANEKVLAAASLLTGDELEQRGGASYESVRGNLAHVLTAQETWYRRLVDSDRPVPDVSDFAAVRSGLATSSQTWISYVDGLAADDLGRILHYVDSSGVPHERSLSLLMLHVVNHGSFPRGETGMLLAGFGHSPGDLDLLYFHDEWSVSDGTG